MRWSLIRLITLREIRDLLRDRRSVMLIIVMPIIIYPLFGLAAYAMALRLTGQVTQVGLSGVENLPTGATDPTGKTPPYPALIVDGAFPKEIFPEVNESSPEFGPITVQLLSEDPAEALAKKKVDVLLIVPPGFANELARGGQPTLTIDARDGDEKSKLAARRLTSLIRNWEMKLREVRMQRAGLPKDFDRVFKLDDPQSKKTTTKKAADELRDMFVRVFPFILIMWLLAGAIQPAVDLTAGEKERGTMETLLISPTERTEIVAGKFLAVSLFAFMTVFWNVLWLTGGAVILEQLMGFPILNLPGMIGCLLLSIPQAMFFSAICVALGVFARSTKEGQYYLMPLILVAMPFAFWGMMPGTELTPGNAWVPVTGTMLLQSRLMSISSEPATWDLWLLVLGGVVVSVLFALWLAVRQFQREDVLFRETGSDKSGGLSTLFSRG